ncbi:Outer membrane protein TolC [Pustulibacterium marinum]|uniref:Outer membrane protein TolC n=1 Tax=Pustulibacterium marinum TaxID=1224947 RepID=A0A1I7H0Q1_9FLAO|nr:TolC family protein [Pustulibacterium marinum]SFU54263.1 Outer membrane protein TolC [Pustulibacterium marinum]
MKKKIYILYSVALLLFGSVQAQDLNSFISLALENNPQVQGMQLQYNIASEKVNEVNTLPNTQFSGGYFVSEPETRTGPQQFKLSAQQQFPWFGSITAREAYQQSLADAEYESVVIAQRKVIASVTKYYYQLAALHAKERILAQHNDLLTTYEQWALKAVETNSASTVSVLKLQMRHNNVQAQQQVVAQQYAATLAQFKEVLNTAEVPEIQWTTDFVIPAKELEVAIETDSLVLHPELVKYDRLYESVTQSEVVNQKGKSPMIGVGVDYINVGERSDMQVSDNGKDIFMPMVSVSIPIFNKSFKSKTRQNELAQQQLQVAKQERLLKLQSMLETAVAERTAARIAFDNQTKNLEQAAQATNILLKQYETNTLDFQEVLDIEELQLQLSLEQVQATLQYYTQTTIIHYLIR